MRQPQNFRSQVLETFRSTPNLRYLQAAIARAPLPPRAKDLTLSALLDEILTFSSGSGRALASADPIAQRADLRRGLGLWDEVKRLNRAFLESRAASAADLAVYFDPAAAETARLFPQSDASENYAMQAFQADSLRPAGLETLNTEPYFSFAQGGGCYSGLNGEPDRPAQWYGPARAAPCGAPDRPQPGREIAPPVTCGKTSGCPGTGYHWRDSFEPACSNLTERMQGPPFPDAKIPPCARAAAPARREGFASHPNGVADYSRVRNDGAEPTRAYGTDILAPQLAAELDAENPADAGAVSWRERDPVAPLRAPPPDPGMCPGDQPWCEPDANATAESRINQHYALLGLDTDGRIDSTRTAVSRAPKMSAISRVTERLSDPVRMTADIGPDARRAFRYDGIPLWQQAGRREYDRDIGATLGQSHTEYEGQTRGWDMDALRAGLGPSGGLGGAGHMYGNR